MDEWGTRGECSDLMGDVMATWFRVVDPDAVFRGGRLAELLHLLRATPAAQIAVLMALRVRARRARYVGAGVQCVCGCVCMCVWGRGSPR